MPYVPYEWHDGSGGGTPITAYRLNQLEQAASEALDTAEAIPPLLDNFATWDSVLPEGGASGQVLTKTSPASFDVEWRTPEVVESGGGTLPEFPPPVYPIAVLVQEVQQTNLPQAEWRTVTLTGEQIDTHNGHSTSTNTGRYTVPASWGGYWEIHAHVAIGRGTDTGHNHGGPRGARILVNGDASRIRKEQILEASDGQNHPNVTGIALLVPGDYVEMQAYQTEDYYTWVTPTITSVLQLKWLRRA